MNKSDLIVQLSVTAQNTPLKSFLPSKASYDKNSVKSIRLVDHVLDFIVKMNMPLSIVDAKPFVNMISACNNKFRLPCRQTVTNKLVPPKAAAANNF